MTFTPRRSGSGERLSMRISRSDRHKLRRGLGYKGIVADLDTGIRWRVYGARCGLPTCQCDAVVVEDK